MPARIASIRPFLEAIRQLVTGMDPFQLTGLWQCLHAEANHADANQKSAHVAGGRTQTYLVPGENPLDQKTRTFAAIEVACLDLIGKAVGKPLCDLAGGRTRSEAPFSAYLFYKHAGGGGVGDDEREDEYGEALDPQSIVQQAKRMIDRYGFREIKLKGGVLDPELEIASMRALREEFGPRFPLRIDPNCAWSVETSVKVGEALHEELSGAGYLEDPTATLPGMAEVRRRLRSLGIETPLASNVAVTTFEQVIEAHHLDAVQIVLSDPHYWGGIRNQQRLSHLCPGPRPRRVDALQQSPRHQHDDDGPRGGRFRALDARLRYSLPLANRPGRSRGRRARSHSRWQRGSFKNNARARRRARLRPIGARARALRTAPLSQARRRSGNAQARRS